jgi:hypothetical protein
MGGIIKGIGYFLLIAGVGLVLFGLAGIFVTRGFIAMLETLNPFNIWNLIMTGLTLAPGLLLIFWGGKIQQNKR